MDDRHSKVTRFYRNDVWITSTKQHKAKQKGIGYVKRIKMSKLSSCKIMDVWIQGALILISREQQQNNNNSNSGQQGQ